MKKILAIALTFALVVMPMFAEEAAAPTLEERVAALEAAPASPLAVSGSLNFGIGADFSTNETSSPVATSGKSATAKLSIASADAKVTASVSVDLLAAPTLTTTKTSGAGTIDGASGTTTPLEKSVYDRLEALIGFWNDNVERKVSDVMVIDTDTYRPLIKAALPADLLKNDDDAPKINIKGATLDATDADNFNIDALTTADITTLETVFDAVIDDALDTIDAKTLTTLTIVDLTIVTDKASLETQLKAVDTVEAALIQGDADTRDAINGALALLGDYETIGKTDDVYATAYASNMIKGADITVKEIGGVADLKMNFAGQHVTAGKFNLDKSGHQSDAVTGYPSIAASLSAGVVEGLTFGTEVFLNSNDNKAEAGNDKYTFLADETQAVEDTKIGYAFNAGYATTVSDMAIAAGAKLALYEEEMGYAVNASFAGMGANASVMYAGALEASYLSFAADYTTMGLTPMFKFEMGTVTDDVKLAFNDDAKTTAAVFGHEGGNMITAGVKADLAAFVPFATTVGFTYVMLGENNVMSGNLSVAPVTGVTVKAGLSKDTANDGDVLAYNAGVDYAGGDFTVGASYANAYNSDKEDASVTMGLTAGYTYGAAKFTGNFTNAWDNDQDELVNTYGLKCSVSF